MRISTQNIACSQHQMNTCHTSFSYILWAYSEHIMSKWSSRTSDQRDRKRQTGGGGGGGAEETEATSLKNRLRLLTGRVLEDDLGVLPTDGHGELLQVAVNGHLQHLRRAHLLVNGQKVHLARLHRYTHEVQHLHTGVWKWKLCMNDTKFNTCTQEIMHE